MSLYGLWFMVYVVYEVYSLYEPSDKPPEFALAKR